MFVTIIIIAITVLVSLAAFNDTSLLSKMVMWPRAMQGRPQEFYRLLTSGFVHADWNHLILNMITLFCFGTGVESILSQIFYGQSSIIYAAIYLSAIIISSVPSYIKHRNDSYYSSLGASGGTSAILFFSIFYFPWKGVYLFFIPIPVPGIIFGVLYTIYSGYMAKKGRDNIGHDAHLSGAVYGFIVAWMTDPIHGMNFIYQLMHPTYSIR